jgi:hypothetical protein
MKWGVKGEMLIAPDRLYIPQLDIECRFDSPDANVFVLHSGKLYEGGRIGSHPFIYNKNDLWGAGVDGRMWTRRKIVAFWHRDGDDDPLEAMEKVNAQHNIEDYTIIFLGIVDGQEKIVVCPFQDLEEAKRKATPMDTDNLRWMWSANNKRRGPAKKKDNTAYAESCRYWKKRIGNMDVAEWHLLMYEE